MTHAVDNIVNALNKLDESNSEALGQFLLKVQDFLVELNQNFEFPAINYKRIQDGKPLKDQLGAEDLLPYRFGMILHYAIYESNPEEMNRIIQKLTTVADKINNGKVSGVEPYGSEHQKFESLVSAFEYVQGTDYQLADNEDEQVKHAVSILTEGINKKPEFTKIRDENILRNEIDELNKLLVKFENAIAEEAAAVMAHCNYERDKIQKTTNKITPQMSAQNRGNRLLGLYDNYHNELITIKQSSDLQKRKGVPKADDFSDNQDYLSALKEHRDTNLHVIASLSKNALEKADALCANIKSEHQDKLSETWIGAKLRAGLKVLFEKLNEKWPSKFSKSPEFLKSPTEFITERKRKMTAPLFKIENESKKIKKFR